MKDTISHALSPSLSSQIIWAPFSLLLFPNNNKYSQRAKYLPQTKRCSYGKFMMSDHRKTQIWCKKKKGISSYKTKTKTPIMLLCGWSTKKGESNCICDSSWLGKHSHKKCHLCILQRGVWFCEAKKWGKKIPTKWVSQSNI